MNEELPEAEHEVIIAIGAFLLADGTAASGPHGRPGYYQVNRSERPATLWVNQEDDVG